MWMLRVFISSRPALQVLPPPVEMEGLRLRGTAAASMVEAQHSPTACHWGSETDRNCCSLAPNSLLQQEGWGRPGCSASVSYVLDMALLPSPFPGAGRIEISSERPGRFCRRWYLLGIPGPIIGSVPLTTGALQTYSLALSPSLVCLPGRQGWSLWLQYQMLT